MQQFQFLDVISQITWSDDSNMILVGIHKRGVAFARNVYDSVWSCKIDEGLAGMAYCRWAPSSRHILSISDFKLRLTIWSLIDRTVQYIPLPKHEDKGIDFSFDGKMMAVVLRPDEEQQEMGTDSSDVVALYRIRSEGPWECVH